MVLEVVLYRVILRTRFGSEASISEEDWKEKAITHHVLSLTHTIPPRLKLSFLLQVGLSLEFFGVYIQSTNRKGQ